MALSAEELAVRDEELRAEGLDPIVLEVNSLKRNDVASTVSLYHRIKAKLGRVPGEIVSTLLRLQDDPAELLKKLR